VLAIVLILSVYLLGPPLAPAQDNLQQACFGLSDQETASPHAAAVTAQQQTPPVQRVPDARDRIFFSNETESLKPLVTKLVRNTILDQKEIWVSPFHMRRQNAKWWLLFGAATGGLIAADRTISMELPNTKDQRAFSRHVSDLGATYTVYPLAAGFYLEGAFFHDAKARETGVLSAEAIGDSLIVVELLKLATSRERPLEGSGKGHFFQWGHDAFPSGHAIQSWAVASVIAHEYHNNKLAPILAYGVATIVSASRFSAQKHWASDIVLGGGMGWFIGRYVYQTHVNHALHQHSDGGLNSMVRPQITPQLAPALKTYAVAFIWHH
jgi:membrane-associated phospholipid phosphatase